jgi:3'-phosphoadenosine 5'-phosphosulfate sulfotransferase (PAPS reductase)/FAD synthetase
MRYDVVMFSGGIGSWAAAKRVAARRSESGEAPEGLVLVFADTLIEDEDLYRFLDEAAANVGRPLVRIAEGRDPWQVFNDVRFLGNSRVDPCSRILKRALLDSFMEVNFDPQNTTIHTGIDWSEEHRHINVKARKAQAGWTYEAPMCEAPHLTKAQMLDWLRKEGIEPPRLYAMGFPHNNCGGFCVKAGQATFAKLLEHMPARYAEHEAKEEALRQTLGANIAVMRDRRGGKSRPMTMREFRERVEEKREFDRFDFGGCGCAVDDGEADQ